MWWPLTLPEPHDARQRRLRGLHPSLDPNSSEIRPQRYSAPTPPPAFSVSERLHSTLTSSRSRQQFSVFALGATFVVLSAVVTRRALVRKWASVQPAGLFSPSNQIKESNGGLDAAEALGLATLNVCSVGLMAAGGGLWASDISNLEELRATLRKGMGLDREHGEMDQEAEEDIEEWMATVLARLQGKGDKDISAMIKEVGEKGFSKKPETAEAGWTPDSKAAV